MNGDWTIAIKTYRGSHGLRHDLAPYQCGVTLMRDNQCETWQLGDMISLSYYLCYFETVILLWRWNSCPYTGNNRHSFKSIFSVSTACDSRMHTCSVLDFTDFPFGVFCLKKRENSMSLVLMSLSYSIFPCQYFILKYLLPTGLIQLSRTCVVLFPWKPGLYSID